LFDDVTNDDYLFPASSALDNNANPFFPPTPNLDILGNPRSGTPDIGAYEN
jgi:hypothetical protein